MLISGRLFISWIVVSVISVMALVLMSDWLERVGIISFPAGFRHVIILMVFLLNFILFGRRIQLSKYYLIVIGLVIIFLIAEYTFVSTSLIHFILGTLFTFLFVFLFILGSNTKTNADVILKLLKLSIIVMGAMSLGSIFSGILSRTPLRFVTTLFREAGAFGAALNVSTIISLTLYIITGSKKFLYIAVCFSFAVLMTILKKSIISNFLIWTIYAISELTFKSRLKFIFLMVIVLLIGFNIIGSNLNENMKGIGASGGIRLIMYIVSFKIGLDYFPFGCGLGTFGSIPSLFNGYSNIYYDYGLANIYELSPNAVAAGTHCLFDTYWPHIIGELGFIGFILFLLLWSYPAISSISVFKKSKNTFIKGLAFYIIVIMVLMVNEGFALYTPELAPFILFHSGIAGLCYYHISNYKYCLKAIGQKM